MNRNISIITFNQFLTNTADSIFQIVLFWYIYHQTGSALSASFVTVVSFTVQIFLSPFIGVISDRCNPKSAMQLSFWILGIVGIVFTPIYLYFKSFIVIYIYLAIMIHTCCMMLESSSKNRLIPQFVGEKNVIKTNGYISSSSHAAALVGNSVGGFLLTALSFVGVMLVHSGLYFLAGLLLLFLFKSKSLMNPERLKNVEGKAGENNKGPGFIQELLDGCKLLKRNRPLLKLIILSCVLNISMINASLLVVLVSDQYQGSSTTFSLFSVFGVLSSILIGLVIGKLTARFRVSLLFTVGLIISGIATVVMGISHMVVVGVILHMFVLASTTILRITFSSFIMLCVEDAFRGRVMSLAIALSAIIVPVVSLLGGYISDEYSVGLVYILSGCWVFIWALFPLVDKDIRRIDLKSHQVQQSQDAAL